MAFGSLLYLPQSAQLLFLGLLKGLLNGSVSITNHSNIYIHFGEKKQTCRMPHLQTLTHAIVPQPPVPAPNLMKMRLAPEKARTKIQEISLLVLARDVNDIFNLDFTVT